jgi:hypothetical protein
MPSTNWEKLAEVVRASVPELERQIAYLRTNPPDPVKQPVTSAIAKAYLSRLEIHLDDVRRGPDGLKDQALNRPNLLKELQEMQTWILRKKAPKKMLEPTVAEENIIGDWLVSTGRSYSEAKRKLRQMRQSITGRGAPNKRPETLRILDAKVSRGLSYPQLASKLCDCGLPRHTEHCAERMRKRISQLGKLLIKYNITYL